MGEQPPAAQAGKAGGEPPPITERVPVAAFDHAALAVWSIDRALRLYRDLLGGVVEKDAVSRGMGFRFLQLRYPNRSKIELLEPLDPNDEANFLVRFLRERGEGPHHLTYYVRSIDAAVAAARAAGLRVVGVNTANPGWKEAFVYPTDAHGTVIQFAETDLSEWEPSVSAAPPGRPPCGGARGDDAQGEVARG